MTGALLFAIVFECRFEDTLGLLSTTMSMTMTCGAIRLDTLHKKHSATSSTDSQLDHISTNMQVFPEPTSTEPSRSKRSSGDKEKRKKKKKAKESGVRSKFVIESLRKDYFELKEENERLRGLVKGNLPSDVSQEILSMCASADAPKASVASIDDIASQLEASGIDEE